MNLQGLFFIGFACVSLLTAALAPVSTPESTPSVQPSLSLNIEQEKCVTFGFEIEGQSVRCVQPVLAIMGEGFFGKKDDEE